jgi:CDP-diacylglycerol--glycerol-3-phosphate 3-phosphatidyltransferase
MVTIFPARWLRAIPYALVGLRVAAAPGLVALAIDGRHPAAFIALLVFAVATDVFDGVLARRFGTSTSRLRRLDSLADLSLYVPLLIVLAVLRPTTVASFAVPLSILAFGQGALYAASFARYGRAPSYHALTAKAWGLGLAVGFIEIYALGNAAAGLALIVALGVLNTLDELTMTALLPCWHADVLTIRDALALRRCDLCGLAPNR